MSEIVDSTLTFNNLAAGIIPIVSSTSGVNPGKSITDGNYNTRWYSSNANPSAFLMDLGRTCNLDGYAIVGGGTKSYEIMISLDRQNWETIYTVEDATGTARKRICNMFDKTYPARYVQVVFTERLVARYGNQVYEFELLGTETDEKFNRISAPTNLTVSAMGTKTLRLKWNAVAGAKEYRVYKSVEGKKAVGVTYELVGTTTETTMQNVMGTDMCSYVVTAVTE